MAFLTAVLNSVVLAVWLDSDTILESKRRPTVKRLLPQGQALLVYT